MHFDATLLFAFLLVFVRCSAMLFASPMFGAQNTPLQVRIFTTLAIAGALTCALKPSIGPVPADMYMFAAAILKELLAGLLIGVFMSLVLFAAQMAGAVIDLDMGLSLSQEFSPLTGMNVTVVAQFKYMLALVLFLTMDCHHQMILAFARSYQTMPALGYDSIPAVRTGIVAMIGSLSLLSLQMAAPVIAVSLIVDAGLGIVNKAVPQIQAMLVGLPAKMILGIFALAIGLPAIAAGINAGVHTAFIELARSTGMR